MRKKGFRRFSFALIFGIGAGFCIVAGKSLDTKFSLDLVQKEFYITWLLCAVALGGLVHILWNIMSKDIAVPVLISKNWCKIEEIVEKWERKIPFWGIFGILLLLWIPVWLSIFPGVFAYDAWDEWMQICTGDITAHHPVIHVLFLGGIVEGAYQIFGNYNLGIAVCTLIQMVILSWCFTYTIQFMRERGTSAIVRVFAVLFYGCSPVVQLFAICGTKDTLFTASFLLYIISVYRICNQSEQFFANRRWQLMFGLSAVFTMILRNNGIYIVLLTLLILPVFCRKQIKRYLLICMSILLMYGIYVGPCYQILGVTSGGIEEILSVPLQQIARVHAYEKDSITEEDLEYLYTIVPQENWEAYRSTVSDFVKVGFQQEEFEKDKMRFFEVWWNLGKEHPLTYINSFLLGTVDFWYPFSVVDGYQDVYGKSSYFDYKVSEPGTEVVLLPRLHEFYESISHEKEAQKIPGAFLVLSPGWYLFIYVFVLLYLLREKKYKALISLAAILLNLGTVLLGPIALVRYVLIQFFVLPMYPALCKES